MVGGNFKWYPLCVWTASARARSSYLGCSKARAWIRYGRVQCHLPSISQYRILMASFQHSTRGKLFCSTAICCNSYKKMYVEVYGLILLRVCSHGSVAPSRDIFGENLFRDSRARHTVNFNAPFLHVDFFSIHVMLGV